MSSTAGTPETNAICSDLVGAGEKPCVILMVGARADPAGHYPVPELAGRHGASVAEETSDRRQACGR